MASVHSFNEALAKVRGVPRATIEAYSRVLRRDGLLPETKRGGGATPLTSTVAAYVLAAVMRGSPVAATENAREVGDLIVRSTSGGFDTVQERLLRALSWPDDMSFACAIGWLIDRYVDGTINTYLAQGGGIKVEIDRYWTMASIRWEPTQFLIDEFVAGWREGIGPDSRAALQLTPDGKLPMPFEIGFHTPLLYEAKISYGVDAKRSREANRKYLEMRKRAEEFDRWGTESVTHKTLIAIAEVFK